MGKLYVNDEGLTKILAYTLPLTSSSTPVTQTTLGTQGRGLAVNASFIAAVDRNGHASLFPQPLTSTSTPTVTFTLPQGTGELDAFDGSGNLWTATNNDTFDEYKPPFTNGMTPALNTDNLSESKGIVFDAAGNLYITDDQSHQVDVFAPPSYTGTPIRVTLPENGAVPFGDVIIGSQLLVADQANNLILVYNLPVTSSSFPVVTFTATGPTGLAADSAGNLYVSSFISSKIFMFAPPFTTGSTPAVTVSAVLEEPVGIAVFNGPGI